MKDKFKQPKFDTTRYAVEVKGDIVPVMGVDTDGTGQGTEIIGVKLPEGGGGYITEYHYMMLQNTK